MVFIKATAHQRVVVLKPFVLEVVNDGLRRRVSNDTMPALDQEVEISVKDVLAEGWVGEDVVD